jgi:hypothetical protein
VATNELSKSDSLARMGLSRASQHRMSRMYGDQERVKALRQEIAEIQRLNLALLQTPRPNLGATHDHARRGLRLREVMHELSMTDWKKP